MPREWSAKHRKSMVATCITLLREALSSGLQLPDTDEEEVESLQIRALRELAMAPDTLHAWLSRMPPLYRRMAGAALLFSPALFQEAWDAQFAVLQEREARIAGFSMDKFRSVQVAPLTAYFSRGPRHCVLSVYHGPLELESCPVSGIPDTVTVGSHAIVSQGKTAFPLMLPAARFTMTDHTTVTSGSRAIFHVNDSWVLGVEFDCKGRVDGPTITEDRGSLRNCRIMTPEQRGFSISGQLRIGDGVENRVTTREPGHGIELSIPTNLKTITTLNSNRIAYLGPPFPLAENLSHRPPRPPSPARPSGPILPTAPLLVMALERSLAELKRSGSISPEFLKIALELPATASPVVYRKFRDSREPLLLLACLRIFCNEQPEFVLNAQLRILQQADATIAGIPLRRFRNVRCIDLGTLDPKDSDPFIGHDAATLLIVHGLAECSCYPLVFAGVTIVGGFADLEVHGKILPLATQPGMFRLSFDRHIPTVKSPPLPFGRKPVEGRMHSWLPSILLDRANLIGVEVSFSDRPTPCLVGSGEMVLSRNNFRDFWNIGLFGQTCDRVLIQRNQFEQDSGGDVIFGSVDSRMFLVDGNRIRGWAEPF